MTPEKWWSQPKNVNGLDCFLDMARETYLYLQFRFRSGHDRLGFLTDPCSFERVTVERQPIFTQELSNLQTLLAELGVNLKEINIDK